MDLQLRPLTTGELLDRTFTLYRRNFALFFGIAALPYLLILAMNLMVVTITAAGSGGSGPGLGTLAAVMGGVIFVAIAYMMAIALSQAASFFAVSSVYLNEPVTISQAFGKMKKFTGRVIVLFFAVGLLVVLGLIVFVVPGVILALGTALAIPAAVLENLGVEGAIRRSMALTKGARGRVALIFLLGWILQVGMGLVSGATVGALGLVSGDDGAIGAGGQIIQSLVETGVGALVAPVVLIAMTLLYYDQRVRKEAFDIQHMMAQLGRPAAAAGAAAGTPQ
jgi:hypothetical protein